MKNRNRILALLLSLSMVASWITPVYAAHTDDITFEQVENDEVSVSLLEEETVPEEAEATLYAEDEIVRVSIQLDGVPLVEQGFLPNSIGESRSAKNSRQMLKRQQYMITENIEQAIGEELNVLWNLTLLTNVISANVEYGQIETIAAVKGVKDVHIEVQFQPLVVSEEEATADMNMYLSGGMTQVYDTWESGYSGVGQRIAIVDSGIDTDHQSFSAMGYLRGLQAYLHKNGKPTNAFDTLGLLDKDGINEKLTQLNAYSKAAALASKLYNNEKIPFGFNYIDSDYDITHDNDSSGNHGSHVAGIAAANRFLADGTNAKEDVWVVGNAPDAQLLVMKVFGKLGGAYESDIYAAIEDAVVLEADTVNLSLGNVTPGFSNMGIFEEVMENLKNCGTTVVISAGNNYDWANSSQNADYLGDGYLYAEDVSTNTIGSPGSATNSMTVASVENKGSISAGSMQLDGKMIEYSSNNSGSAQTLRTIASLDTSGDGMGTEHEYVMLESYGTEEDFAIFNNNELKDKIVLVSRGMQINFGIKAQRAAAAGAKAVIIYNNVSGSINMNLEGYEYDNPCVFITLENAEKFKAAGIKQTASDGSTYYAGKVTIVKNRTVVESGNQYLTMSDFSCWGTTGDLALKPEITAPGGMIYSVNGGTSAGAATDRYIIMSGTSMAAPQIAGIGALINEYIEGKSYEGEFANPLRGLAQSLMMSTAIPIKDKAGNNYSLLQQGAGLANAAAATSADSYIKMSSDATPSYDDGKVKAELGDDPDRTGIYSFDFEIHNLDGMEHTYDLSAEVFAQGHFAAESAKDSPYTVEYMDHATVSLDAVTRFTCGGEAVKCVTVPANGEKIIRVTIALTEGAKKDYLETYFEKGTYIQAFVYADAQADAEGNEGTTHSIPMLAFYGSWTDPSMYWGTSTSEGEVVGNYSHSQTTDYTRAEYFKFDFQWGPDEPWYVYQPENYFTISQNGLTYNMGGNPLVADHSYMPERNAISNELTLVQGHFNLIRNATKSIMQVKCLDTEEILYSYQDTNQNHLGAFWNQYSNGIGEKKLNLNVKLGGLNEGETVEFSMAFLPEYYNAGKRGENAQYGEGAVASVTAVVDKTLPQVQAIELDAAEKTIHVSAADNQYISAVVLYNASGDEVLTYAGAKQEISPGEKAVFDLDYSNQKDNQFLLQVFDYALNMATYRVTINEEDLVFSGAMYVFNQADGHWAMSGEDAKALTNVSVADAVYNAATSIGGKVFAVNNENELHVLDALDMSVGQFVDKLDYTVNDLAYNTVDGYIYGVSDEKLLIQIEPSTGNQKVIGNLPFVTNTLACDADGNFYSNLYGTGEIYSYTLETVTTDASMDYDFNGDKAVNLADAQYLLDYVTGKIGSISNTELADIDADGDVDTYDAYLLNEAIPHLPELLAVAYSTNSKYLQTMEVDLSSGMLYWASYFTDWMQGDEVAFSYLWSVNLETGEIERHTDFWDQLTSMVIFDVDTSSKIPTAEGVVKVNISNQAQAMAVGETMALSAGVSPWNVDDPGVVWSSTDESIAVVDENGMITAIASGECQIIATSRMDEEISAVCEISVMATLDVSGNEYAASEMAGLADVDNSTKTVSEEKTVNLALELKADELQTNGLQTVSVDITDMALMSVRGADLLSFTQKEGLLTIGYVNNSAVNKGDTLVTLNFQAKGCGEDRVVVIRELQRNNDHVDLQKMLELETHDWGEWNETTPATCVEPGERTRICSDCGQEQYAEIPANGIHSWTKWETMKEATCVEMGEQVRCCETCDAEEKEEIPATGIHAWSDWNVRTEASEKTEGLEYRTCGECEEEQTRVIPATGEHAWGEWTVSKEAGCLTAGKEKRICEDCAEIQIREIPAIGGHDWSGWSVTVAPGEESAGQETRVCEHCGETETRALPATGHICPSEKFSDLDTSCWYHKGVDYILNQGYMKGMSDTVFAPDGALTRGQLVTILYRVEGMPSVSGQDNPFTDVAAGSYYMDAIIWAASEGVVNGVGHGLFAPDQEITREQIATILYRYDGSKKVRENHLSIFSDVAKISNFAKDAMNWAVSKELVKGMGDGTVSPQTSATRAQIATILMRYLENV